ncbi:MAG: PAS domain S-box protein [Candidatus Rokubacteria bacterium]|nr:PAS domain S-box protein [Candidatus Rokubacteria bacterium]
MGSIESAAPASGTLEQALRALRESEARYRGLVDGSIQGIAIHQDFVIRFANPALARIFGHDSPAELIGRNVLTLVAPEEQARLEAYNLARLRGEPVPSHYEFQGLRRDGARAWIEGVISLTTWDDRPATLVTLFDLTERKQLEQQFLQSQKMEAVGRLAGGIAHDFNNLLTVILGRTELLLRRLVTEGPARRDVELIQATGRRAAALTQQLLAVSRRQVLRPQVLDLNTVVSGLGPMLRRVIGEDLELSITLDPGLGRVLADPSQIEQVLLNLVINARDAMPGVGRLTIETANAELDERYAHRHAGARPGQHVMLAVSDTGSGMDEATRARIFEPFFTTKERGTGLGLATVHGVVSQSGGTIWVYSEPGRGTTFKVYLPRAEDAVAVPASVEHPPERPRGSETILLVEDDEDVRALTREALEAHGYTVLDARGPEEALALAAAPGLLHLLVADVVMPRMSGRELAAAVGRTRPGLRVLYVSGYAPDAVERHGILDPGAAFLSKPFTPLALAQKVWEVLAAGPA